MQHQSTLPVTALSTTRAELYRWQLTLFHPTFKPGQLQVSHQRVKANSYKHRTNKQIPVIMPICMDRISGKQLFAPENMARLLCLVGDKFKGVTLHITILLTGELCAWNTLRRAKQEINADTLAAARSEASKQAYTYQQALTPIVQDFMQSGHTITFSHWADVCKDPMIARLSNHLLTRYKIDPDYTTYIDIALAKFYLRQHEQGEVISAKLAKKYNIQYLTEELAYAINTYAFQNGRYEFQLYEYDDLSPKLAEAALLTCKDFLAEHNLTFANFGTFMLEYKQQELDATTAEYKKTMQAKFTEMENVFSSNDASEIALYQKKCDRVQIVISSSSIIRSNSFVDAIVGRELKRDDRYANYNIVEQLYDHNPRLIPGAICRTMIVEGNNMDVRSHYELDNAIDRALFTLHYFTIAHYNFSYNDVNAYTDRFKSNHKIPLNCLVAVFDSPNVCLFGLYEFELLRQRHTNIAHTLYFGITHPELQKLLAIINSKDFQANVHKSGRDYPKANVKLMSPTERQKQIQKFLYNVYHAFSEHEKSSFSASLKYEFDSDDRINTTNDEQTPWIPATHRY